ncbi:MAG: TIR domain-containing protein [Oscillospiraceae bacterium]|nr:TIR domain-containing protein [Oscillospiraceae bacterium]
MVRHVFFSFHYNNDVSRAMIVRNSWVTQGKTAAGFVDKAEFEKVEREGEQAVRKWITEQLNGTSVTVVLIGAETLERPYVQYEIQESLKRGNGVIGVYVDQLKDLQGNISKRGNVYVKIGDNNGSPVYFVSIADKIYDYVTEDGYNNLGQWIEGSAKKHGK